MTRDDLIVGDLYLLSGKMRVQIAAINTQSFKVVNVDTGQHYFLDYAHSLPRLEKVK